MNVVALAGGVGAARFLRGLVQVVEAPDLAVVANTADDLRLHGLHVSPDLDTITYTLGGGVHTGQGWGRADETFTVASELAGRYDRPDWFTLGDRDIATHLFRTQMLAEGSTLSQATAAIAAAWEVPLTLLPMTDDQVTTVIVTADGRRLHFQQWWVRERAEPAVATVAFEGAAEAAPAPGVLEAIARAEVIVLCPSNPVVSIGPILALAGVRDALRDATVVGVSPIVGGRVVRGMADRLLQARGVEVSCAGVAQGYADFLDGWVIDDVDSDRSGDITALGCKVAATQTIMETPAIAAAVARTALDLVT